MKAKVSGQFQGSGGKQSIEIDGSIDLPDFTKLLERVAKLEEEVKSLALKELTQALKEETAAEPKVELAVSVSVPEKAAEVLLAKAEEEKVVSVSKAEEEADDADDDDKDDDKVANKAQKQGKVKKPAGKP